MKEKPKPFQGQGKKIEEFPIPAPLKKVLDKKEKGSKK